MDIAKGDLIIATAGREKGDPFLVLATEGEYLFLADGKRRRIEAPKRKKRMHVRPAGRELPLAAKIRSSENITNSELRRALAAYRGENGNQDQEG